MLLSLIVFLPLLFALIVWISPARAARTITIVGTVATFLISLRVLSLFDKGTAALQLVEKMNWVPDYGISYFLGIDGISIWLVLLTTFLTPLIIVGSWTSIDKKIKGFHINMLILETAMLGTFLAMDAVLFYTFFEMSLVPMYFIVGIWGGSNRLYATMKFFIYTMVGSVLMLVAIISLMLLSEQQLGAMTASLPELYHLHIPYVSGEFLNPQTLMFVAFCLAFAIKVPMFPVHTWLPDAHVEAPTPGSVILAGVMLKMGTYGFLRFVLPLFPEAAHAWGWIFLLLGVIGIIYGALVAMIQPDMKKLVAYSSVSHMGYVVIGIFAMNQQSMTGAIYQMLNHGVSTGALFLLVGMIYERTHSREISKYGGLAPIMPIFTILFIIVTLSSIAVPGTNGFVGEFLILIGTYARSPLYGTLATLGVILGASYMLWMVKKVFFGKAGELVPEVAETDSHAGGHGVSAEPSGNAKDSHRTSPKPTAVEQHDDHGHAHPLLDLTWREIGVMSPLIVLIFWMGIHPQDFLSYTKASVDNLSQGIGAYSLPVAQTETETKMVSRLDAGTREQK